MPTGFKPGCFWAAGLILLYGTVILIPSGNLGAVFLPMGAMIAGLRLHAMWTFSSLKHTGPGIRSMVAVLAADLVFLIALQYGLLQSRIDFDRGNFLGAVLSMTLVAPVLALLARAIALSLGKRLFRF